MHGRMSAPATTAPTSPPATTGPTLGKAGIARMPVKAIDPTWQSIVPTVAIGQAEATVRTSPVDQIWRATDRALETDPSWQIAPILQTAQAAAIDRTCLGTDRALETDPSWQIAPILQIVRAAL